MSGSSRSRRLGLAVGVAALIAGGVFAYGQFRQAPNTPEQAVEDMLRSAASGDAIGVAEAMLPAERQVLLDDGIPAFRQLQRLAVVDNDVDLDKVKGISGSLTQFAARTETLRSDLAAVHITNGTLETAIDPASLPFGSTIGKRLAAEIEGRVTGSRSISLKDLLRNQPIIVKRVKNRWYFSAGYQAVELVRRSGAGKTKRMAVPKAGSGVDPTGAESPEEVIRAVADAAAGLDFESLLSLLPAKQYGALQEYGPELISLYSDELSGFTNQYSLSFPELKLRTTRSGNTAKVHIVSTNVDFSLTDPDAPVFAIAFANNCAKVTLDTETTTRCGADIVNFADDYGIRLTPESLAKQAEALRGPADRRADLGFTVVRQDGAWYWSPTKSALVAITDSMSAMDKDDLPELRSQMRLLVSTFFGT